LDALGRGLLKEFRTPSGSDCPGAEVLRRSPRMRCHFRGGEVVHHLGSCTRVTATFANSEKHTKSAKNALPACCRGEAILIAAVLPVGCCFRSIMTQWCGDAVLDLRNRSVARGPEENSGERPLELSHRISHLNIYLPFGSNEGPYSGVSLRGQENHWLTPVAERL